MKISDKLLQKYAVVSPMLPPPLDDLGEEEVIIPTAKVPEIKDLSEEEMRHWEDFIAEKKLRKDLGITQEITDLGEEEKRGKEEGTRPAIPKRKAFWSPDALLKMCSHFCDIAHK